MCGVLKGKGMGRLFGIMTKLDFSILGGSGKQGNQDAKVKLRNESMFGQAVSD